MDYNMKVSMVIDSESKKNAFRDALKADIEAQYANNNLKSWNMSINGVLVADEDNENYSSIVEE